MYACSTNSVIFIVKSLMLFYEVVLVSVQFVFKQNI